jgi:AcrR family transcriptional regulator
MYKLCKTEQSARRQREIECALLELLATRRYEDITVTELCEYMNMPRKAFYRYFDSKEDTLRALIEHSLGEFTGFRKTEKELEHRTLQGELEEYFEFWKSKTDLLSALERNGLMGIFVDSAVHYPVGDIVDVQKFFSHHDGFSDQMLMHFTFSGLVYVMIAWYKRGFEPCVTEMAANVGRIFTKPLFPNLSEHGIEV